MTFNRSEIKWSAVIVGVVIAFVIAYGSSIGVVTGYATYLSIQARGAPDVVMINNFAAQTAPGITSFFIGIGVLVGSLRAGRKAQAAPFQNGLIVGLAAAFIELAMSLFGGVSVWAVVSVILALGGGWLGGKISTRGAHRYVPQNASS
ncbi:MAG: hypothetical protein R2911_36485 [Caldilineaceae bacterium]